MKHIAILTDSYYPIMTPVASCVSKFVEVLKFDNRITIIYPITRTKLKPMQASNVYYREISCWHNTLRSWCNTRLDANKGDCLATIVLYIVRIYGFVLSIFAFPTRSAWMRKGFYKALKRIDEVNPIDVVISASDPFCSHLAVLDYKKNHMVKKWITYSLDPFYYNSYNYTNILFKKARKRRNLKAETDVYQTADYNIFTEELFEVVISLCNLGRDCCLCFPYTLKDFSDVRKDFEYINKEKPLLVYAGTVKSKIRNPALMLSVISKVDNCTLTLYSSGDCDYVFEKYRVPNVEYNRLLPKDEYIETIVNKADILVNIGNTVELQSPSKFLELLSTGKPIVNFYNKKDAVYKIVEKYPLGLNVGDNSIGSVERVRAFVAENNGKRMSYKELVKYFPNNSPNYQKDTLLKIING